MRILKRLLIAAGLATVIGIGVSAWITEVHAAPCRCPLIYAPVQCSKGQIYPNQCEADCHHAKDCVPIGPF